jgi:hypothetical protein
MTINSTFITDSEGRTLIHLEVLGCKKKNKREKTALYENIKLFTSEKEKKF